MPVRLTVVTFLEPPYLSCHYYLSVECQLVSARRLIASRPGDGSHSDDLIP